MKNISFRDLQLCSRFKGMNEIAMLSLDNDESMAWALSQIGFDVEYPVAYIPLNHRDMQGKTGVGFLCVGEINMNISYTRSNLCTPLERVIVAAYTDPSLARELSSLMGMRVNFRALLEHGAERRSESFVDYTVEPDYGHVSEQIKNLEAVRDAIRGEMLNDRGEAKCFGEYLISTPMNSNKKNKKE